MKATRSICFFGVIVFVSGLLMVRSVFWQDVPDAPDGRDAGAVDDRVAEGGTGPDRNAEPSSPVDRSADGEEAELLHGEAAQAALRAKGQYASLGAALAAARHAVDKIDPDGPHSRGADYFAANPGQQLRAWFSGDGVELASGLPTPEGEEPWNLRLRLAGVGRGTEVVPVAPGLVTGAGSRIEVVHVVPGIWSAVPKGGTSALSFLARGAKTEGNALDGEAAGLDGIAPFRARRGVEATIQSASYARPGLRGGTPESRVTQWFENGMDGLEQGFTLQDSPVGHPGELAVLLKAEGTLHVEARDEEARICFADASGAEVLHYTGLKAWDATGRGLAARMEVRGNNILAVVVDDARARYPVTIDPLFANVEARLLEDSVAGDQFGAAVALSGEVALIGAPFDDTAAGENAGSVYVFARREFTWSQQAKLTPTDGTAHDRFGASVAVSGNTALVGAPAPGAEGVGTSLPGSAYVFARSGGVWQEEVRLVSDDGAAGDWFGGSVALSGNTALIGAWFDDTVSGRNAGSAYVFERGGPGWSQQTKLVPGDAAAGDEFGAAVALSGETAVIGARFDDTVVRTNAGSAYVFEFDGVAWGQQAKLIANQGGDYDGFGGGLALSGDTVIVGASGDDTAAGKSAGSAFVFVRSGSVWNQEAQLGASDASAHDAFGCSVALEGDTALIGAWSDDAGTVVDAGSAYAFERSGTAWSELAKITADADASPLGFFGTSVALAGQFALIGVPGADTPAGPDAGSVSVFYTPGWSREAELTAADGADGDQFGYSVALEGDTALVGAPLHDTPAWENSGSVFVFARSGGRWVQQAKLTDWDGAHGVRFGSPLTFSGDTALVGALEFNAASRPDTGSVHVFVRSGTQWSRQARLTQGDAAASDGFGSAVALSGDTAVVGAWGDDMVSGWNAGSAYVFERSGMAWSQAAKLTASDAAEHDYFGDAVAIEGDIVLVGAPQIDPGGLPGREFAGSAYVFERIGSSWSQSAKLQASDAARHARFGVAVALRGETALVGSSHADSAVGVEAGSAYVFVRGTGQWREQAKLIAVDVAGGDHFGSAVALFSDYALVGTPDADVAATEDAGRAYVFERRGSVWVQQAMLTSGVDASTESRFGASVALSGDAALVGAPFDDTVGTDAGSAYVFLLGDLPEIAQHPQSRTVVPGQAATFVVVASGYAPLSYQWRFNGYLIDGANSPDHTVASADLSDQGLYDCVVSNVGGVVTSAVATLVVNDLSEFGQTAPSPPSGAAGTVVVTIAPPVASAAWRFVGEKQWRTPGFPVGDLVFGTREIEFRPVPGYHHPPRETVIVSAQTPFVSLTRTYYDTPAAGTGGLSVVLKPDTIAGQARWRFLGEDGTQWRISGHTETGLVPGSYLVECKAVAGVVPPPPANVVIEDGGTPAVTLVYSEPDAQTGALPELVPFDTVTQSADLPYQYVGQIRSDAGLSSGFVVKPRVVATAAHVVFNDVFHGDGTPQFVTGLQWLFQRDSSSYEPEPQVPRGFYLFDGYAAARQGPGVVPGEGTSESQHFDAAALYFLEGAGRGGAGGYLASDATDNEFLLSAADKMIVGYPVDEVESTRQGRMHATPPMDVGFARVPGEVSAGVPFRTYTTHDVRSTGGCSGGPLCIRFEGGSYYPAGIYLGGSGQTVVRAIDSEVIDLFERAETSANGGGNNTSGGISHTEVTTLGVPSDPGTLRVVIAPEAARLGGAGWRLVPETIYRQSAAQVSGLAAGSYRLEFAPVPGYQVPTGATVALSGGTVTEVSYTYLAETSELEAWRLAHFGTSANTGDAADGADPDGDGCSNIDEWVAGTDPNDGLDCLRVVSMARVGLGFTVEVGGKAGRVYEMQLFEAPVSGDPGDPGTWTTRVSVGPLELDAPVVLTDPAIAAAGALYRVRVSKP